MKVGLFILATLCLANPTYGSVQKEKRNRIELGGLSEIFLPNEQTEFSNRFTAYGLRFGLPIGTHTLQSSIAYGMSDTTHAYILDLSFRLNVKTPFFSSFFSGGGFVLHYQGPTLRPFKFGPSLGTGFGFSATKIFDVLLGMKLYFADRPMAAFSGSIVFLL